MEWLIPLIFGAAKAVTGYASYEKNRKANKAQRLSQASARRQQEHELSRQRIEIYRDTQRKKAIAVRNAFGGGVQDSSGAAGGQGSIESQGNSAVGYLIQQKQFTDQQGSFLDQASRFQSKAQGWDALGELVNLGLNWSVQGAMETGRARKAQQTTQDTLSRLGVGAPIEKPLTPGSIPGFSNTNLR